MKKKKHAGFAYAYRLPGMNKVLQAAGRVIRDSTDQGVILLLDQRFHTTAYQQLFPLHWQHAQTCFRPEQLSKAMDHFWQKQKTLSTDRRPYMRFAIGTERSQR